MKIKRNQENGTYHMLINNVPSYEIYNGTLDVGYSYWQVRELRLLNDQYCPYGNAEAFSSFKEAKEYVKTITKQ